MDPSLRRNEAPPTLSQGTSGKRVDVGLAIRATAAAIPELPKRVLLSVLGLTVVENLVQGLDVLQFVAPLLGLGAAALVVASLATSEPGGLRPLVVLSLHRLPAAIGAKLAEFGVYLGVFLVVSLTILYATGKLPEGPDNVRTFALVIVVLSMTIVARWMCALPFVIVQSYGPIAALRASWRATRGSWFACLALVVPISLVTFVPVFVAEPLRLAVGVVVSAATTIFMATVGVVVYRQLGVATWESADAKRADTRATGSVARLRQEGPSPAVTREVEPMADSVLTEGFGALQPGEMISVVLLDLSDGAISGQVLAADDDGLTIFEPPSDPAQSGYFEEIPADRIASITRHGSAPLTMTVADAFKGDAEPKGKTEARLERAAGLILLGLAVVAIAGAVSSLYNALSRRAEEGEAELVALGQLGAVLFGVVGLMFFIAAVGVLRGTTWGRRLGLVVSGLIGALGTVAVLGSPMPWDHGANLGIYQATPVEWLLTLVPVVACWIAVVALIRGRSVPEGV